MTTLDDRLYAWLSEPDDRRFTLAFNSYFLVAFPAVMRHLARFAPADPALLEEIAQDALLRFFEHIGRGRREASQAIEDALSQIRPVSLGSLHERQVRAWTIDVDSYRSSTMGFRLARADSDAASTRTNAIQELALKIPTLQRQGWHLIDGVRIALQWHEFDDADMLARSQPVSPVCLHPTDAATCEEMSASRATNPAAANFACAVTHSAPSANSAETRLPGALQLVYRAVTIIRAIPCLRVPTNGYLFEISYTIYLDDYRKRHRQKRGGPGPQSRDEVVCSNSNSNGDDDGAWTFHPLEDQRLDESMDGTEAADVVTFGGSPGARFTTSNDCTAGDPIRRLEEQQYFEHFYRYLRAPVDAAEAAYDAARAHGRATAERRKWDSLRQKFSRSVAILAAIGEGYTQEQTAERLRLTRNQVKYVIETLQDAYARFAAQSIRSSYPSSLGGVPSHGK
jgi:hypothetical protein